MEKVDFLVGSEKRFFDFISSLNDKDKIALVSHNDLDGIVAAKVANLVLKADFVYFVDYAELNYKLVEELKEKKVRKIVFMDLSFEKADFVKDLEKFASILSIDHHPVIYDFNSDKSVFLSVEGNCAAYVCYYLFSKLQDISTLDWLVAGACISDHMYDKNYNWMKSVYERYEIHVESLEDFRGGRIYELQRELSLALVYFDKNSERVFELIGERFGDIGDLGRYAADVKEEMEICKKKFLSERERYGNTYFWEFKSLFPIKVPLINELSMAEPDKNYIVCVEDGNLYKISARRQNKQEDMGLLLRKLVSGLEGSGAGGHIPAAGAHVLLKDKEEFIKRLREYAEKR